MWWLLERTVMLALEAALNSGALTAEQQTEYEASHRGNPDGSSRILSLAGDTADIAIQGVLTAKPDFMAAFFGGGNTTYPEIIAAIAGAELNSNVKKIVLSVDSPGGTINGMFDAIAALQGATKPIEAVVSNIAASAAFGLVAQADTITASNQAARFGSIGIATSIHTDPREITVTSTEAPNKRPDLTTQAGKDTVRKELDDMHALFVGAIAEGRNTTPAKVNADFGQGGMLLANEALNQGMIDGIAGVPLKIVESTKTQTASGGEQKESVMDKNELMAQHPALFAEVVEEGVTKGVAQERDRVVAHLTMGTGSGDMKTALAAVEDGSEMTGALQSAYMVAGMNRKDTEARQGDDDDAAAGDGGNDTTAEQEAAAGDNIARMAAEKLGVTLNLSAGA